MEERPAIVLVVDDELDILRLVEAVLRGAGHAVTSARNADEAIRAVEAMPIKPSLLLTDVVMPGMSGPVLVDQLLAAVPGLGVLFMSGYDERQVVQRYVVEKGFALLAKPFTPQSLLAAVQKALEASRQAAAQSAESA